MQIDATIADIRLDEGASGWDVAEASLPRRASAQESCNQDDEDGEDLDPEADPYRRREDRARGPVHSW
jgi:hypothetical protein